MSKLAWNQAFPALTMAHADPLRRSGVLPVATHLRPKVGCNVKVALAECEIMERLVNRDDSFAGRGRSTEPFWRLHIIPIAGEA